MELEHLLARDGEVARAAYLRSRGVELAEIRACLRSGSLRPLRRGWYAAETADPKVVKAVRSGGVLGCVSALHHHDVWVPRSKDLHVRGRSHPCRQYGRPERELRAIDDPPIALRHAVRCLDEESIVVVCDSLLYKRKMSRAEITRELRNAPTRIRRLPDRCDAAESGTESIVRLRLRARNIRVRTQVAILGIGRVDLLVGRLIIEVDGAGYHTSPRSFETTGYAIGTPRSWATS